MKGSPRPKPKPPKKGDEWKKAWMEAYHRMLNCKNPKTMKQVYALYRHLSQGPQPFDKQGNGLWYNVPARYSDDWTKTVKDFDNALRVKHERK